MQSLITPNSWSCLATAAAMALDVPLDKMLEAIGHDGSEIIWPDEEDPIRRRAFVFEDIQFAALKFGKVFARFSGQISFRPKEGCEPVIKPFLRELGAIMCVTDGVIVGSTTNGNRHAVAWSSSDMLCFDPNGSKYRINNFKLESFYGVYNIGFASPLFASSSTEDFIARGESFVDYPKAA